MMMTLNEKNSWRTLVELGAKEIMIFDKHALDLSSIRITSKRVMIKLPGAIVGVAGIGSKSSNRRHVDRIGNPIYIVTDDSESAMEISKKVESGMSLRKSVSWPLIKNKVGIKEWRKYV